MHKIYIVKTNQNDGFYRKEKLLKSLPKSLCIKANRYLDVASSIDYITGRLLLKYALIKNGFSESLLENISYSTHGKPSLKGLNFSISHSNGYVVFVCSTENSLGIDIEMKKNIDLKLFEYLFTEWEWSLIMTAKNKQEQFYWYWVRKEALLKASGCALHELKDLEVFEHHGIYKEKRYYFKAFDFDADFNGMLAMEKKEEFEVERMYLEVLLMDN